MISLTVNGRKRRYPGPPFKRLIDVLREDFGLTGAKEGCGEGECGACTVLLDGKPVTSCLIPVCQARGRRVETVESLGRRGRLDALQKSFAEHAGAQCGFCTPGILMTAAHALKSGGAVTAPALRAAMAGNLCRCTGYEPIVESIAAAARGRSSRKGRRK